MKTLCCSFCGGSRIRRISDAQYVCEDCGARFDREALPRLVTEVVEAPAGASRTAAPRPPAQKPAARGRGRVPAWVWIVAAAEGGLLVLALLWFLLLAPRLEQARTVDRDDTVTATSTPRETAPAATPELLQEDPEEESWQGCADRWNELDAALTHGQSATADWMRELPRQGEIPFGAGFLRAEDADGGARTYRLECGEALTEEEARSFLEVFSTEEILPVACADLDLRRLELRDRYPDDAARALTLTLEPTSGGERCALELETFYVDALIPSASAWGAAISSSPEDFCAAYNEAMASESIYSATAADRDYITAATNLISAYFDFPTSAVHNATLVHRDEYGRGVVHLTVRFGDMYMPLFFIIAGFSPDHTNCYLYGDVENSWVYADPAERTAYDVILQRVLENYSFGEPYADSTALQASDLTREEQSESGSLYARGHVELVTDGEDRLVGVVAVLSDSIREQIPFSPLTPTDNRAALQAAFALVDTPEGFFEENGSLRVYARGLLFWRKPLQLSPGQTYLEYGVMAASYGDYARDPELSLPIPRSSLAPTPTPTPAPGAEVPPVVIEGGAIQLWWGNDSPARLQPAWLGTENEQAPSVVLLSSVPLRQFSLLHVTAWGDDFTPTFETLLRLDALEADRAVRFSVPIAGDLLEYAFSFVDAAGVTHVYGVGFSGEDGSLSCWRVS